MSLPANLVTTRRSTLLLLGLFASLTARVNAQGSQGFVYSVELDDRACDGEIRGTPGSEMAVRFTMYIEAAQPGLQEWSVSLRVTAGSIVRLERDECDADCMALRSGGKPGDVFFIAGGVVDPDKIPNFGPLAGSPQGHGFAGAGTFSPFDRFSLGAGKFVHQTFQLLLKVPEDEAGQDVRIEFIDGMAGFGEPNLNRITFQHGSYTPLMEDCSFRIVPAPVRPGDFDRSGILDITDVVALLTHRHLGYPPELPCEGTIDTEGNVALNDFNGDRKVDMTDSISFLYRLFLGGPPHVLGRECILIDGCRPGCR